MRLRKVNRQDIFRVLSNPLLDYPAKPLSTQTVQSRVYEGMVGGRILKVYVKEGSRPPLVRTVAWKDEE